MIWEVRYRSPDRERPATMRAYEDEGEADREASRMNERAANSWTGDWHDPKRHVITDRGRLALMHVTVLSGVMVRHLERDIYGHPLS
jgi:hypothetical protein